MRRVLTFVLGVIIGQWLVFDAAASPAADYHIRAQRAMEAHDYLEAMRLRSYHSSVNSPAAACRAE